MLNFDVKVRRTKRDRQKTAGRDTDKKKNENPKLFNSPQTSVQSKQK